MDRRETKYHDETPLPRKSRVSNNEHLYDELNNKIVYEEIVEIESDIPIDLSMLDETKKNRENYKQIKEYQDLIMPNDSKKDTMMETGEELLKETRNFDINAILEEAKKNRNDIDELERKRNLRDDEINVLSSLNRKYLHKRELTEKDTEEIKDLINTITSNNLLSTSTATTTTRTKDEKDLLSELMTESVEKIKVDETIAKDVLSDSGVDKEESGKIPENSFYTKSMEIKEEDFESDEEENLAEEKSKGRGIVIAIVLTLVLAAVALITYFALKHFGIELF